MKMVATIKFDVSEHVGRQELREFIKDALETWGGQVHPEDLPFTPLRNVTVKLSQESVKSFHADDTIVAASSMKAGDALTLIMNGETFHGTVVASATAEET